MSNAAPVTQAERIASLDVLRGFALLGILLMNIGAFSMPAAAYFDPTAYGDLTGINLLIWQAIHVLADLKFMAIFSMLFGAGIVLMSERCEAKKHSPAGLHYRRVAWLIIFGLMHAHLLWYGDILYWYGVCGLWVFLFRNRSPKVLIIWGLLFLAVASGLMALAGWSSATWPPDAIEYLNNELKPPPDVIANEVAIYQSGWLEQMESRVPKAIDMETSTFLSWAMWRVTGLMLLGMALFKLGVFSAKRSKRFYLTLIGLALGIGIPVVIIGINRNFADDWASPLYFFYGTQYNYWASILVSLGWVGAVMLLCRNGGAILQPLAAVGRTAFSNYILQTVLCTTIFYGHGIGLFGNVERSGQLAIVLVIWVIQLVISPLWLKHFRFGPLEWLWRVLVYMSAQPLRRTP